MGNLLRAHPPGFWVAACKLTSRAFGSCQGNYMTAKHVFSPTLKALLVRLKCRQTKACIIPTNGALHRTATDISRFLVPERSLLSSKGQLQGPDL